MKVEKNRATGITSASSHGCNEVSLLFDFIEFLDALKVSHENYNDYPFDALRKVELRYNKNDISKKLRLFKDKGLI